MLKNVTLLCDGFLLSNYNKINLLFFFIEIINCDNYHMNVKIFYLPYLIHFKNKRINHDIRCYCR